MTAAGGHSADGRWWWDGAMWVPAYSADGRWWWNGAGWVPVAAPVRQLRPQLTGWRRWARAAGVAALVVMVLVFMVGGVSVMGDPGPEPGAEAALAAAKMRNVSVMLRVAAPFAVVGAALFTASFARRRPRRGAAEPPTRVEPGRRY
ncbi:MAG: hypothetical protein JWM93_1030 [Frankiales bacterium]|nr:hypothetical protein [Frankiales bacterium]